MRDAVEASGVKDVRVTPLPQNAGIALQGPRAAAILLLEEQGKLATSDSVSKFLPDYPTGHLIAHQLEEHMRKAGKIGPEVERITRQGRLSPDLWMQGATGSPVAPDALLAATYELL